MARIVRTTVTETSRASQHKHCCDPRVAARIAGPHGHSHRAGYTGMPVFVPGDAPSQGGGRALDDGQTGWRPPFRHIASPPGELELRANQLQEI